MGKKFLKPGNKKWKKCFKTKQCVLDKPFMESGVWYVFPENSENNSKLSTCEDLSNSIQSKSVGLNNKQNVNRNCSGRKRKNELDESPKIDDSAQSKTNIQNLLFDDNVEKTDSLTNNDEKNINEFRLELMKLKSRIDNNVQSKYKKLVSDLQDDVSKSSSLSDEEMDETNDFENPSKAANINADKLLIESTFHDLEKQANNDNQIDVIRKMNEIKETMHIMKSVTTNSNDIDLNQYIKTKSIHVNNTIPDLLTYKFEDEENDKQKQLIHEAFEDDDIEEVFDKEKEEEIKNAASKDLNLFLPGWGSWGGMNIEPNQRQIEKHTIKFSARERKDTNLTTVIINEKGDESVRKYMVNKLPYPYTKIEEFENSLRVPIGRTFVPESAFFKFIKPEVITKPGTIIKPMDANLLMKKKIRNNNNHGKIVKKKTKRKSKLKNVQNKNVN